MPTPTYDPLASITVASNTSSVTFSNLNTIAAGYKDLVIIIQSTSTGIGSLNGRINGDTGNNYTWITLGGNGSTSIIQNSTNSTAMNFTERGIYNGSQMVQHTLHFLDFSGIKHKVVLCRNDNGNSGTSFIGNRWRNGAAITSIEFYQGSQSFVSGATFSLYGIAG